MTTFVDQVVLHVAAGECIKVTLTNQRSASKASFHVGALLHDLSSSGINVGNNPGDQTVAPGASKTYTYFADTQKLGKAHVHLGTLGSGTRCTLARAIRPPPDPI